MPLHKLDTVHHKPWSSDSQLWCVWSGSLACLHCCTAANTQRTPCFPYSTFCLEYIETELSYLTSSFRIHNESFWSIFFELFVLLYSLVAQLYGNSFLKSSSLCFSFFYYFCVCFFCSHVGQGTSSGKGDFNINGITPDKLKVTNKWCLISLVRAERINPIQN